MQCDAIVASVDAARRGVGPGGGRGAELLTPTSKLGAAVQQENDGFLESEGERQQLLLRCDARSAPAPLNVVEGMSWWVRTCHAVGEQCAGKGKATTRQTW